MDEKTTQTQEILEATTEMETNVDELPENLFSDESVEPETTETTEVVEDEAELEAQAETLDDEQNRETSVQTVKVKYNGKEQALSLEEAVILAQKGMNYDHVKEELESLREGNDVISRLVTRSGLSRGEYFSKLESSLIREEEEKEISALEEEYPDASEEVLREMAKLRMQHRKVETAHQTEEKEKKEQEARIKPWREFFSEFPDVDVNSLPDTVRSEIIGGKSPVIAYQAHLINELRKEKQSAEQMGFNKARTMGSARGDAEEISRDSFLDGFNSAM